MGGSRTCCTTLLLLFVPAALAAGPIEPSLMQQDIEILAHPALRGREAGTPEADLAARIVARNLSRLHLRTVLQPVPLLRVSAALDASVLEIAAGESRHAAAHGREVFIELTGDPPRAALEPCDVAFAGWGIHAPEYSHDDYADLDARGKALFVWSGEPQREDGGAKFGKGRISRHGLVATKLDLATKAGASLLLIAAAPGGRPAEDAYRRDEREKSRPRVVLEGTRPSPPVVYLTAAAAAHLLDGEGVPRPGVKVRLALEGLRKLSVDDHNVVAILPGTDPALATAPVVLAAHHDHIGADLAADGSLTVYPGADDNASGVAALLAVADALARGPAPPRPVVFASFAAEEKGALGARWFAEHPEPAGSRPFSVIDLDMVGRNNLDRDDYRNVVMASYTARAKDLAPLLAASAGRAGLDARKLPYLRPPGRSDDTPFAERDIPSVMLFTGPHRDYNTAGDLPERIIPEKAAAVAHMALDLVRTLAARKDRLSWDTSMTDPPPADTWDRPY